MKRFPLWLGALALAALVSTSTFVSAGDPAPTAEPAKAAPAEAPVAAKEAALVETATDAPKTGSPVHTLMVWVGKQVMPQLDCPCPAKAEGEAAWRAWFAGGADVPLAGLRDAMVADGWTADKYVAFFQEAAKKAQAKAEGCQGGACADKADGGCKDCPNAGKCAEGGCKDCPSAGKCAEGGCKDCPKASKAEGSASSSAPADKAEGSCGQGACPSTAKAAGGCNKGQCPSTKETAPEAPAEAAPKP